MTSRFATCDGLSLVYEDSGAGLPLLCLPGLTRNARDFDDLKAALPGGLRMICLTLRGRGASDWDEDFSNYAVPVEARDVVELLDHLELDKVVVVGTSRGGIIAMMLAAMAKDRLAGVLLNDVGPALTLTGLDRIMGYVGRRPAGKSYADVAAALEANMGQEFPDLGAARWQVLAERWFVEDEQGVGLRYDPRIRDAMLAAMDDGPPPDLWPLFDMLDGVPMAVLRGANSDLLSVETVGQMKARRPDLIAVEVPDRGHVPFLDEPESLEVLGALIAAVER